MSRFRRVVTGHNPAGKSIVASDSTVNGVAVPGLAGVYLSTLWGADQPYNYPDTGAEASHPSWFPPIGGVLSGARMNSMKRTPPMGGNQLGWLASAPVSG